ncbi:MAG: hypothetical protein RL365_1010 [Bacteroidota bacterium]
MNKITYDREACACAVALDLLGDKWSLLIVRDLFRGKNTYSAFLFESAEKIASNVLNDRLKKLRGLGIIEFRRNAKDLKIKEYYLTDRGIDLYPIIYELQKWTIKHVNFRFTENTEKWNIFCGSNTEEVVVEHYVESYKKLRLENFGF